MTTEEFAIAFRADPVAALTAQGYAAVAAEIAVELTQVAAVTDAFAKRLVGAAIPMSAGETDLNGAGHDTHRPICAPDGVPSGARRRSLRRAASRRGA